MASGKRASMREGPLAALFRKTEEGQETAAAQPPPEPPVEAPPEPAAPRTPTPQERLRHAFSSDLPENMMAPPQPARASAAEYEWTSAGARGRPASPSCAWSASAAAA